MVIILHACQQVKQAELEAIRGTLAEVDGQLSELKASFQEVRFM